MLTQGVMISPLLTRTHQGLSHHQLYQPGDSVRGDVRAMRYTGLHKTKVTRGEQERRSNASMKGGRRNTQRYTTERAGRQCLGPHSGATHTHRLRQAHNTNKGAASRRLVSRQAPELCTATRRAGSLRLGNKPFGRQGAKPTLTRLAATQTLPQQQAHSPGVAQCRTNTPRRHATFHTPTHPLPPGQCPVRVSPCQ